MKTSNLVVGVALVVLAVWAVAPTTAQRANRVLVDAFPARLLESPATCATPHWPDEARRYEVDGITVLNFTIGVAGTVEDLQLVRSSGWRLLDDAAGASLARCRFKTDLDQGSRSATYPVQFVWTLAGPAAVRPALVAGSCAPSEQFHGFDAFNRRPSAADGVLVRFLVDPAGKPFGVKAEVGQHQQQQARAATAFMQTCTFGVDAAVPGEPTDTVYGRVLVK